MNESVRLHTVRAVDPADDWREVDQALDQAERDRKRLRPHYQEVLLKDGALVEAAFLDVAVGNIGGAEKWLALFEITGCPTKPEAVGLTILRSYNRPTPGWLSPQHALSQDFAAVTGLRPQPIPKTSPRAILGGFLREVRVEARTHVVGRRMDRQSRDWIETPTASRYSVIDRIRCLTAGCPRVVQRRRTRG